PLVLETSMHPGVSEQIETLFQDPRTPARPGDLGRGPLPASLARFDGIEVAGDHAVLSYHLRATRIREWFDGATTGAVSRLNRHIEAGAHATPLHFAIGSVPEAAWAISSTQAVASTKAGRTQFATNLSNVTLRIEHGELVATLPPATSTQRLTFAVLFTPNGSGGSTAAPSVPGTTTALAVDATPVLPATNATRRWPESAVSLVELESLSQNGLILDRIAVPEDNPWHRRVRAADIAFLSADEAAIVTYDGDVWIVSGFGASPLAQLTWRRFASGLHEPLAIAAPGKVIQVATKNGVIRLHDRDQNGEADWYENFNDQLLQSRTSRSFPLDMAVAPDGSTYITQGGIVDQSGIKSGGTGTAHSGAILKISPDGRSSSVFAQAAREPFVAVHPKTGVVTGTDQQGHYISSSVSYLVREGDSFGFLEDQPEKLTPPLAWIPHEQDTSSSSESWIIGDAMGAFNDRLLHLSYGTGRMFIISPDLAAPIPQAAAIPLELKTELPLLHARMHPPGDAMYLVGFQIWGTRAATAWGLGRLRVGPTPIVTAVGARSLEDGVILDFAQPVDPASLKVENVLVRAWNYHRGPEYGSGRYTLEGPPGTNALGVGQIVRSNNGKSVFIQLPHLPRVMQMELRHDFKLASGSAATGVVYFTVNQPRSLDLTAAGFPKVDLTKNTVVITQKQEDLPTSALGKTIAENLGCAVCHSTDGSTEGKVGPTWKNLYATRRTFVDGTTELADEIYLRAKILDPMKKRVTTTPAEMPSYRGVVSESQLESLVLYIKSLRVAGGGQARPSSEEGGNDR
ncbi:MAG: c-type cytochrome, partial [Opitutus sp.]